MAKKPVSVIDRKVAQARRRLWGQLLLNRLGLLWGLALALSLGYFILESFAWPSNPTWVRWSVLGGSVSVGTFMAIWLALRGTPSRVEAGLALDQRFQLKERITTVLALSPAEITTPMGQAVLADANAKVEQVAVAGQFPVRVGKRALFLPVLSAAIVLLVLFPPPTLLPGFATANKPTEDDNTKVDDTTVANRNVTPRPFLKPPEVRNNKSEELKQLEAELEKLYAEHNVKEKPDKVLPEQARERVEKITDAEDRLKKREKELNEKFQKLQEQLGKLTELDKGEARHDGPGKDFEDALAKGDLQKAKEEVDRLQKKVRDKKLDEKEADQLKKQLQDLDEKVEKLTREKEKKKEQLKDLIDQAKKENRDAESLERELKKLEDELKAPKEMQDLAKALKQAKKALEMNDFEGLDKQLDDLKQALEDIDGSLEDLEDISEHLQNLKQMKKTACKECEGQGPGKSDPNGHKDDAKGYAEGATGRRAEKEDPNAKPGEEKRVRGFFDARGKKYFGGTTEGPAFKKQTTGEMAGEIQQAVQDAPEAIEVQRLPKAAKDMVKEYFEKLGGQAPKK